MKQISKLCQECIRYKPSQCHGKDAVDVKPGKLPCKKYELDPQLISNQDIEPDSPPPSLKDRKLSKPKDLVPDAVLVTNQKKAADFKRLATQRLIKTLDDIRKLGNLARHGNYEWEYAQVSAITGQLYGAISDLEKKLQK